MLRGVVVGCVPDFGAISARGCGYPTESVFDGDVDVTYLPCLKRPPIESASSRPIAVTSLSYLRRIPIESASSWSVILTLMDNTQIENSCGVVIRMRNIKRTVGFRLTATVPRRVISP